MVWRLTNDIMAVDISSRLAGAVDARTSPFKNKVSLPSTGEQLRAVVIFRRILGDTSQERMGLRISRNTRNKNSASIHTTFAEIT